MYFLTKEKKNELQSELNSLINVKRIEVADEIRSALKNVGRISENNDLLAARDKKDKLEIRIEHLEDVIKNSKIVRNKKRSVVEVGATVIIQKKGKEEEKIFHIVGREEFDIMSKKIPVDSPLAKSMMGKKVDDMFEYITPTKKVNVYRINKIF